MYDYSIMDVFYSEDTIYHYTTLTTAIDHILAKGQLRLSPMSKSKDPLEVTSVTSFPFFDAYTDNQKLRQMCLNVRHLCFCRNRGGDINRDFCSIGDLGFVLPRMWDQYGDHFQGVCLAFSKKKLKAANPSICLKEREYLSFEEMENVNDMEVARRFLRGPNTQISESQFENVLFSHINHKHNDFAGENEIKALSLSEDKYVFIPFKDSLVGIVYNILDEENLNYFWEMQLIEYSQKYKAELIRLHWRNHQVQVSTSQGREEWAKLMQSLNLNDKLEKPTTESIQ